MAVDVIGMPFIIRAILEGHIFREISLIWEIAGKYSLTPVAFVIGAVFAAAGALVISYLYFHLVSGLAFFRVPGPVNVLLPVPLLLPFTGRLLLGILRRRKEGNILFGGRAGALGAELTTLAVPFFVIAFISDEIDLNWSVIVGVGPWVLGIATAAALLGALLTGAGAWLAGRVKGTKASKEQVQSKSG